MFTFLVITSTCLVITVLISCHNCFKFLNISSLFYIPCHCFSLFVTAVLLGLSSLLFFLFLIITVSHLITFTFLVTVFRFFSLLYIFCHCLTFLVTTVLHFLSLSYISCHQCLYTFCCCFKFPFLVTVLHLLSTVLHFAPSLFNISCHFFTFIVTVLHF